MYTEAGGDRTGATKGIFFLFFVIFLKGQVEDLSAAESTAGHFWEEIFNLKFVISHAGQQCCPII